MEATMCKKCGTVIMPDEFFCPQCGTPVKMLPTGESGESADVKPESSDSKSPGSQQVLNSFLQGDGVSGFGYENSWIKPGSTFKKDYSGQSGAGAAGSSSEDYFRASPAKPASSSQDGSELPETIIQERAALSETPAHSDSLQQNSSGWGGVLSQEGADTGQGPVYPEAQKPAADNAAVRGTEPPVHREPDNDEKTNVQNKTSAADVAINQDAWNAWMKNNILEQQKTGNHSGGNGSFISGLFGRRKRNP